MIRYHILRYFAFSHLQAPLSTISEQFHDLAWMLAEDLPHNAETSVALRKLLEAKDAAVRSALDMSK